LTTLLRSHDLLGTPAAADSTNREHPRMTDAIV
jgi:hypothetical protein